MTGGNAGDTYLFNLGDGKDTITDNDFYHDLPANEIDRVVFGTGIRPQDVVVKRVGNALVADHINGIDGLSISNWFSGADYYIERFEFSDGTVWDLNTLRGREIAYVGTTGADVVTGWDGNDRIDGGAGNDTLYTGAGTNVLLGGLGDDRLEVSGAGVHTLEGGDGNDTLNASVASTTTMRGGAGNDTMSVTFWTNASTFNGGTGIDTMTGGNAGDTYLFNLGDGKDTITDNDFYHDLPANEIDRVVFGTGIRPQDVVVKRVGNALVADHINGIDGLSISNWFSGADYYIERFEFSDGTVWDLNTLRGREIAYVGTTGADVVTGWDGNDRIDGGAGNDTLYTGAGTNVLLGGLGDDRLEVSGAGVHTLEGGDGNDTLNASVASLDHARRRRQRHDERDVLDQRFHLQRWHRYRHDDRRQRRRYLPL